LGVLAEVSRAPPTSSSGRRGTWSTRCTHHTHIIIIMIIIIIIIIIIIWGPPAEPAIVIATASPMGVRTISL
jgi:hypothetical protein